MKKKTSCVVCLCYNKCTVYHSYGIATSESLCVCVILTMTQRNEKKNRNKTTATAAAKS